MICPYWFFVEMPRFRRQYLIDMKQKFPDVYAGMSWPRRWQDRMYARVTGVSSVENQ